LLAPSIIHRETKRSFLFYFIFIFFCSERWKVVEEVEEESERRIGGREGLRSARGPTRG